MIRVIMMITMMAMMTMIRIIKMITAITTKTMITMITMTTESLAHMQSKWPCPYRPFRTPCRRKPSGLPGDNSETERPSERRRLESLHFKGVF